MLGILGKKNGMTQIFKEDGTCVSVTSITAGPCYVVQVKEKEKHGYRAMQIGYIDKKEKHATKAEIGHCKKGNTAPKKYMREIPLADNEKAEVGQKIEVDIFKAGDFVDVSGISIGKGFQGGMKRWGWSGGPESHGSMSHRRIGSKGANTSPGRTVRGHHMPGQMGNSTITVQSLEIIKIDKEANILLVKGAVPGHKGCYLVVRKAKKK
jgi:large subunit ribosomal protein L3